MPKGRNSERMSLYQPGNITRQGIYRRGSEQAWGDSSFCVRAEFRV